MNKRTFLKSLGTAAFGFTGLPSAFLPLVPNESRTEPDDPGIKNWVWMGGNGERNRDAWKQLFADLNNYGISGVLASGGDLEILPAAAGEEGLEFHRWIWTLNRNGDRNVQQEHPEWFSVSRNGDSSLEKPPYVGYYKWLCPTRPEVLEYLKEDIARLARHSGLTGIHLDYIRHPDVILPVGLWEKYNLVQDKEYPEFDFCYCEVCREEFRKLEGTDPLELPDPTRDIRWREFRYRSITTVVNTLAEVAHQHGKRITAAVFPTPQIARKLVRQEWEKWHLDAFFPMIYHNFYNEPVEWTGAATREGVRALPPTTPLYSGLYIPALKPDELKSAVKLALEAGARGVSLFSLNSMTEEHWKSLREAPTD